MAIGGGHLLHRFGQAVIDALLWSAAVIGSTSPTVCRAAIRRAGLSDDKERRRSMPSKPPAPTAFSHPPEDETPSARQSASSSARSSSAGP